MSILIRYVEDTGFGCASADDLDDMYKKYKKGELKELELGEYEILFGAINQYFNPIEHSVSYAGFAEDLYNLLLSEPNPKKKDLLNYLNMIAGNSGNGSNNRYLLEYFDLLETKFSFKCFGVHFLAWIIFVNLMVSIRSQEIFIFYADDLNTNLAFLTSALMASSLSSLGGFPSKLLVFKKEYRKNCFYERQVVE
ncbi:hypothetical protein [Sulfurimonas sp.]